MSERSGTDIAAGGQQRPHVAMQPDRVATSTIVGRDGDRRRRSRDATPGCRLDARLVGEADDDGVGAEVVGSGDCRLERGALPVRPVGVRDDVDRVGVIAQVDVGRAGDDQHGSDVGGDGSGDGVLGDRPTAEPCGELVVVGGEAGPGSRRQYHSDRRHDGVRVGIHATKYGRMIGWRRRAGSDGAVDMSQVGGDYDETLSF